MNQKLSFEEITEISQLEQDYAKIKLAIGDITTKISDLDDKLTVLENEKYDHLATYKTIIERDKMLNSKLQQKYGRGIIDMNTGEISPA